LPDDKQSGKTHESSPEETQLSKTHYHAGIQVSKLRNLPLSLQAFSGGHEGKPNQGPYFHQKQIISWK